MQIFLENISLIINSLINWISATCGNLLTNPIFIVFFAIILFTLVYSLIINLINEREAKQLAVGLTGSTSELEYYRSLSDEEKAKFDEEHL